ncbi:acid phosphatase [Angomonas deanei]|nr:acid phosphatase [Angomonas deanei]|eukprot:EPY29970.1 acid phosphatase [Angomonas deanei]
MDTHEYLLDDVPCFRRAEADSRRWIEKQWGNFSTQPQNAAVMKTIERVCGNYSGEHGYKYLKTIADGMTFNTDMGLKVGKGKDTLGAKDIIGIRNLSYQLLFQRLYNTDEQQTYTVVDLPRTILQLFNHTHIAANSSQINDFRDTRHESSFFFVHRESLYALAQFFGWRYEVPGLPPGEVPVAASLIIEKLMPKEDQYSHDEGNVYLRFSLWTPNNGRITVPLSKCRIPELCELKEVRKIYDDRIARTGSWETLCDYTPQEMDHTTDIR